MSHEAEPQPAIDHFSDEAIASYTALMAARKTAARHSLIERALIPNDSKPVLPFDEAVATYTSAISGTIGMYTRGYRRQLMPDDTIRDKLLPRIVDEHRLFGTAEQSAFLNYPNQAYLVDRLESGHQEDNATLAQYTADVIAWQRLDEAVVTSVHKLGELIVQRAHIDQA